MMMVLDMLAGRALALADARRAARIAALKKPRPVTVPVQGKVVIFIREGRRNG